MPDNQFCLQFRTLTFRMCEKSIDQLYLHTLRGCIPSTPGYASCTSNIVLYRLVSYAVMVDTVLEADLTVKPRNTVALAGDRVVLRCSTDSNGGDGSQISWAFSTQNPSCRPSGDACDLVFDSVRTTDAGGYDCSDPGLKTAHASLIVIGNCNKNSVFLHKAIIAVCRDVYAR